MSPNAVTSVAAVNPRTVVIWGKLGGAEVEMILDSGSSVSLIKECLLPQVLGTMRAEVANQLQLVTASGEPISILDHVRAPVQLGDLEVTHDFVVVKSLVAPVILGVDFLYKHGVVLDFTRTPVAVRHSYTKSSPQPQGNSTPEQLLPVYEASQKARARACVITAITDPTTDVVDECAVPKFGGPVHTELPTCSRSDLAEIVHNYQHLFRTTPGVTSVAHHFIPTTGNPVRIPPRRIPAHYRAEVERQLQDMLNQGIIEESSSPWMAPAVFVPKKSGDLRLCIDYRELNKKTSKDAYPLPLPDEVQDRLAGSTIFTKLDLHSGYWQLPVNPEDCKKTAFCPGPGMGLFQFLRMPFGLTGAPSSFQRLMDQVLRGLPFVSTYVDDILIHSHDVETHRCHLEEVFQRLTEAGLTLRGRKCEIGMPKVSYLGHVFSAAGMSPDPQKTQAVTDWPTPTDASTVRQFLGLASYYRRYIPHFADIAAPLHALTQKGALFAWTQECAKAFNTLKDCLTDTPVLAYPKLDQDSTEFQVQTDASNIGIGVVLEQDGHAIAYASRSLTSPERHYSVIQKECLAIVYSLKQFRHYLLGRHFKIVTDHRPLQWLSAQKMEGMLCRWALSMQEYDFKIIYREGSLNTNADALSRRDASDNTCAATVALPQHSTRELHDAQEADSITSRVLQALSESQHRPQGHEWCQHPLRRYRQLWPQLKIVDGVLCRQYTPGPTSDKVLIPVLPTSLRQVALNRNHDAPSAGHLGSDKTLERLRQEAYWVGMARDVNQHCRECTKCQQAKLPAPQKAPLTNVPIGRPWQMVAVDILEVPLSFNNNRYLLVVQDYFTKWADAIPIPDQLAARITAELVRLFSIYGPPDILHSDQGRNFESTVLAETLQAFGVTKSRTTAYHPQCDGMVERFNRSLLQLLRAYVDKEHDWERYLPLVLYAYRTSVHSSTGASPFTLMYGRQPQTADFSHPTAFDSMSYPAHLLAKRAELQDFVESNIAAAAARQKSAYDQHCTQRTFSVGDHVWLSIPTAGKLDPRWEGKWKVKAIKGPVNMEITDGRRTRVVHVNRLQKRLQAHPQEISDMTNPSDAPSHSDVPWIEHEYIPPLSPQGTRRYPARERRPPDRLSY